MSDGDQSEVRVENDVVSVTPGRFPEAVDVISRLRLRGITVREDWRDDETDAPTCDLSLLTRRTPWVETLAFAPGLRASRVDAFESIYALRELRELGIHQYARLDAGQLARLEVLFVRDSPRLVGLDAATSLRKLRVWGIRSGDLSVLQCATHLESLWLIQSAPRVTEITGLDRLGALHELELHHCRSVVRLGELPPGLRTLKVHSCPKMTDFAFLRGNGSIEFFFASKIDSLDFLSSMRRIERLAFDNVVDGNLTPILAMVGMKFAGFADKKHYSHRLAAVREAIGVT
ncbi:MAG: hypothetical protein KC668_16850 [Myxococcales bacterium]|nr:hypothetical protein [Myxococcales bacterium]